MAQERVSVSRPAKVDLRLYHWSKHRLRSPGALRCATILHQGNYDYGPALY